MRFLSMAFLLLSLTSCDKPSPNTLVVGAISGPETELVAVAKEVAQYQANRNLNIEPPYCQPVAFKNLPPATQAAQALNAAARRSKSV